MFEVWYLVNLIKSSNEIVVLCAKAVVSLQYKEERGPNINWEYVGITVSEPY